MALGLVLLSIDVTAAPAADLTAKEVNVRGFHEVAGTLNAFQVYATDGIDSSRMSGYGNLTVTTSNVTAPTVMQVGGLPERGGETKSYHQASLAAGSTTQQFDLFAANLGVARTAAHWSFFDSSIAVSQSNEVRSQGHVNQSRPDIVVNTAGDLLVVSIAADVLRFDGTFVIAVWGWTVDVAHAGGSDSYFTGVEHRNAIGPPGGPNVVYDVFEQVATIEVREGWLEISGIPGAEVTAHHEAIQVGGQGVLDMTGVSGFIQGTADVALQDSSLTVNGDYQFTSRAPNSNLALRLTAVDGSLVADGVDVPLGDGPLHGSTVQANPGSSRWWSIAPVLGIAGLMLMAVIVKGPATMARFNRLEMSFEDRDYAAVLRGIDSFTEKRQYRRRANFIKAVSLLSVGNDREASLFLETLTASDGPDPATRSFLLACAAAHRGDDATTLTHLTACFAINPEYKGEAEAVPALKAYLPFFDNREAPA